MRAELLPPLSPGGAACRADRHLDKPCRIPLREETSKKWNVVMNRDKAA